jgi:hypothetical protein
MQADDNMIQLALDTVDLAILRWLVNQAQSPWTRSRASDPRSRAADRVQQDGGAAMTGLTRESRA